MGSSASVPNGVKHSPYTQRNRSSANKRGLNNNGSLDYSLSGVSSGSSTPSSRTRSLWSRLTPSKLSKGSSVSPLPEDLSKTVQKVFDQLEFQNTRTDRADIQSFKRWHDAQKILNNNPQLMMGFISATKRMYLRESKELVNITNDLVKLDLKNAVSFPKEEYESGLFSSLIASKSADPNSIATRMNNKTKIKDKQSQHIKTGHSSEPELQTGKKTPGATSRTVTVKRKKRNLAELVQQQRTSITTGSRYDKRLSIREHQNLAEIAKHVNSVTPRADIKSTENQDNINSEGSSNNVVPISINHSTGRSSVSLSLREVGTPGSSKLYADSGFDEVPTPPIATPHPVQRYSVNRLAAESPEVRKTPSSLPPLKSIPSKTSISTINKLDNREKSDMANSSTDSPESNVRCVSCTSCGKDIDMDTDDKDDDDDDTKNQNVSLENDNKNRFTKNTAPDTVVYNIRSKKAQGTPDNTKNNKTKTKSVLSQRQSAKSTQSHSLASRPDLRTKSRPQSRPVTGAAKSKKISGARQPRK